MTSTVPDDARGVLAALRERQSVADQVEIDKVRLAVAWAAMHSTDSITGPVAEWTEQPVVVAGPGTPEVSEFCIPELAVALSRSHDSAAGFLGEAIELAYRLPRTYARVLSGDLRVWKALKIARATIILSTDAAGFVDQHVAPTAHKIGWAALDRLIEDGMVRFDPVAAEEKRRHAAEQRCFDINLRHTGHDGITLVNGWLDRADALDLENAVQSGAADLAALGSAESMDVRRSQAVGVLARRQLTLDLNGGEEPESKRASKPRQTTIYVHLDDDTCTIEGGGCLSVEQVKAWCTNPDTQVVIKPVIDLNATNSTDTYAIPDAIREQVILRDPTCVFPECTVSSRRCDLDHLEPWSAGGRTTPLNLAPLCRRHHRAKTHSRWRYQRPSTATTAGPAPTASRPPTTSSPDDPDRLAPRHHQVSGAAARGELPVPRQDPSDR